jgi:VWFA-related protein
MSAGSARWNPLLAAASLAVCGAALGAQSQAPPPNPPPPAQQQQPPQKPDPQQQPTFRLRVDSISVDVSVTDRDGRPVTDLKPEDFEIREAGKPQKVETFRLVQSDTSAQPVNASRQILSFSDMQRETADPANRLFIIFLDDYHTRKGNALNIRRSLMEWVTRELTSRDLVAVLYPHTPVTATTFSRHHEGTAEAVMRFEGRKYNYDPKTREEMQMANFPAEVQEQFRNEVVIRSLRSICSLLSSAREGRKSVLYVSEGMNANLPPGVGVGVGTYGRVPPTQQQQLQQSLQRESQEFFRSADLVGRLRDVFTTCSRGNTAIYSLNPRGLATSEFGVTERPIDPQTDQRMMAEATDLLRTLADQTDGQAIIATNDPLPALRKMRDELGVYYLLGYTSSIAPRDGKFHEIEVKVNRRDVEVRARKGYWAYTEDEVRRSMEPPKPGPPQEVAEAIDTLAAAVEPTSRRTVATWIGATRADDGRANVLFVWEAPVTAGGAPADTVAQLSVTATSLTGDAVFTGKVPRDPAALRPSGSVSFVAPPGPLRLRLVMENARGQRVDSEDVHQMIPDFTATGPTITEPLVFRARTAKEIAQLKAAGGAIPSAARLFSRAERLLLRFDAYGPAGTSPQVTLRLLNRRGEQMATLPPPEGGASTFHAEVGFGGLPPGDYLIEIAAATPIERSVKLLGVRVTG